MSLLAQSTHDRPWDPGTSHARHLVHSVGRANRHVRRLASGVIELGAHSLKQQSRRAVRLDDVVGEEQERGHDCAPSRQELWRQKI